MNEEKQLIQKLKEEQEDARQLILALSEVVYVQAISIKRLKSPSHVAPIRSHIRYILKRVFLPKPKELISSHPNRTDQTTHNDASDLSYHPGISIRLKSESAWVRNIIALSRRLRGKSHARYEIYIVPQSEGAKSGECDSQALANSFLSILSKRGV